ncbi:MAG: hypothetical protein IJB29_05400 [Mailhella sp.]|nr:hypothetical protein [Mailhella sp.]
MLYAMLQKRRGLVLALFVTLMAACAFFTSRITPDSSIAAFFPDSSSRSVQLSRLLERSPLTRLIFVDIEAEKEELLLQAADQIVHAIPADMAQPLSFVPKDIKPENVLALLPSFFDEEMERRLSRLDQEAMRTLLEEDKALLGSLASSFVMPWVQKDPLQLRSLLAERIPEGKLGLSASSPYPISEDSRHMLLLFRPADHTFAAASASALVNRLESVGRELSQGVSLTMSGGPLHTAMNARTVENDISRIVSLSLVGLAVLYFLMIRSVAALWLVLIPAAATLTASGLSSLFWPSVSALALGFGASLMGLAEDYATHMLFGLRHGEHPAKTHSILARPLFVSCLLNLSGFFLLLFSGIPAVRQLALFSIISLGAGCLMAVFLLPLLPQTTCQSADKAASLHRDPRFPSAVRVTVCTLFLCAGLAVFMPHAKLDFSPRTLGAHTQELLDNAEQIRSRWSMAAGTALAVRGASFDDALENVEEISARLRASGVELTSPSDFLPTPKEQSANLMRWKNWLEGTGKEFFSRLDSAAASAGFSPNAFHPFRQMMHAPAHPTSLETLRSLSGDMAELFLFLAEEASYAVISLADLPQDFPLDSVLKPELADQAFLLAPLAVERAIENLFHEEKTLIGLTILFSLAALCLSQRSLLRTMLMVVSPLTSVLAVLAVFLLLGKSFTLTACVSIPIVLGLSIDHGIMVVHALESGMELGIRKAVTLSTLTALLSMGLLAFAEHPALNSMGTVILTGLLAELFSALVLLPLLCKEDRR